MRIGHALAFAVAGGLLVGAGALLARAAGSTPEPPAPSVATGATVARPSRSPAAPVLARRTIAAMPGLDADLRDRDPRVRRAATAELARDPSADPGALRAASRDADLEVSVVATTALGKLYAAGELPASELVAAIRERGLPEKTRIAALNGLGVVPAAETGALLAELLARGDMVERRTSAILLMHQDAAAAVPALIAALADADEYVRGNALEALRHLARGRDFGTDAAAWRAWWQSRIVMP